MVVPNVESYLALDSLLIQYDIVFLVGYYVFAQALSYGLYFPYPIRFAEIVTSAEKVTVSVLYWYEKLRTITCSILGRFSRPLGLESLFFMLEKAIEVPMHSTVKSLYGETNVSMRQHARTHTQI